MKRRQKQNANKRFQETATPEAEATITGMANTAIFARFRATDRKNAAKG